MLFGWDLRADDISARSAQIKVTSLLKILKPIKFYVKNTESGQVNGLIHSELSRQKFPKSSDFDIV